MAVLHSTNGYPKHIASTRMCDLIVRSHGVDGLDDSAVHRKMPSLLLSTSKEGNPNHQLTLVSPQYE